MGHVFVVQGRIGHLDCDAIIVPTDRSFVVEEPWHAALGVEADAVGDLEPESWAEHGVGRGRSRGLLQPAWFVDVVRGGGATASELRAVMGRLGRALEDVAAAGLPPGAGRAKLLVALPTLGTGGGGFADVTGAVVDAQLATCQDAVAGHDVDVVIVAATASDYTAFQAARLARGLEPDIAAEVADAARALAERARRGELALFVGAGVSMAAGLPSWEALIATIAERHDVDLDDVPSPLDRAELLRRELGADFGAAVARETSSVDRYAITHSLLAALGCREIVTTNYDALYERAARDIEGTDAVPALPYGQPLSGSPWVLKMHGDVSDPAGIVLTRSDFVRYDSRSRPLGSVVQALMLTRHLLVVGASLTDDNFLRLAHEVVDFQEQGPHGEEPRLPLGTVLDRRHVGGKARLWEGVFDYVAASERGRPEEQSRDLAIVLDLLAAHAAGNHHLLDPRYADLLASAKERKAAGAARELHARVASLGTPWEALAQALALLGGDRSP
ncbi:SIR2-like domain-containing protein [Georgenia satyanarayanai]|uniref:SIR2-like domain-containing protein n=1 Tax=Georgenia satyanarayanai TaxID=860221 RepID=A0A2Y8ZYT6_9MICO|nr:SIR2 family protein [Georgenia satyanarayanai]PYG01953.1 SIR2-like protein [Georgenia satyanarayanai]SSA36756.1 SIR2-like domain-containing protein [Georgenia satyanarayanai]